MFIKNKIKEWLGIDKIENDIIRLNDLYSDLVGIGVDVHINKPQWGSITPCTSKF